MLLHTDKLLFHPWEICLNAISYEWQQDHTYVIRRSGKVVRMIYQLGLGMLFLSHTDYITSHYWPLLGRLRQSSVCILKYTYPNRIHPYRGHPLHGQLWLCSRTGTLWGGIHGWLVGSTRKGQQCVRRFLAITSSRTNWQIVRMRHQLCGCIVLLSHTDDLITRPFRVNI